MCLFQMNEYDEHRRVIHSLRTFAVRFYRRMADSWNLNRYEQSLQHPYADCFMFEVITRPLRQHSIVFSWFLWIFFFSRLQWSPLVWSAHCPGPVWNNTPTIPFAPSRDRYVIPTEAPPFDYVKRVFYFFVFFTVAILWSFRSLLLCVFFYHNYMTVIWSSHESCACRRSHLLKTKR